MALSDELEALAKKHGATSYRNRADTQNPAFGFSAAGLESLLTEVRKQDDALILQLVEALEYHRAQTRPTPLYTHPSPPGGMVGGWVAIPGALPEPGKPVLLDIGMEYPIRAMWAAKHALEVGMEDDSGFGEYDEATDTYYCPEDWYEWNEHEDVHWRVTETPRAWAPLPPTTSAGSGKGE